MWVSFLKLLIVFPIIILLLISVLQFMNKYIQPQSLHQSMKLIQQMRLSTKTTVSIVKVASQYLVIACNEEDIKLITTLSAEDAKEIESYTELQMNQQFFKKEMINESVKKMNRWWKNE